MQEIGNYFCWTNICFLSFSLPCCPSNHKHIYTWPPADLCTDTSYLTIKSTLARQWVVIEEFLPSKLTQDHFRDLSLDYQFFVCLFVF